MKNPCYPWVILELSPGPWVSSCHHSRQIFFSHMSTLSSDLWFPDYPAHKPLLHIDLRMDFWTCDPTHTALHTGSLNLFLWHLLHLTCLVSSGWITIAHEYIFLLMWIASGDTGKFSLHGLEDSDSNSSSA